MSHPITFELEDYVTEGETESISDTYQSIEDIYDIVSENALDVDLPDLTYDYEVYDAYASLQNWPTNVDDLNELVERAEEAYAGEFSTRADFAREQFESTVSVPDEWWTRYIDFAEMGDDLMMDYSEENNHYFRDM